MDDNTVVGSRPVYVDSPLVTSSFLSTALLSADISVLHGIIMILSYWQNTFLCYELIYKTTQ